MNTYAKNKQDANKTRAELTKRKEIKCKLIYYFSDFFDFFVLGAGLA